MAPNTRDFDYKVHGEEGPRLSWNWEGVEKVVWPMVSRFGPSTNVTHLDKVFDKFTTPVLRIKLNFPWVGTHSKTLNCVNIPPPCTITSVL